MWVLLRRGRSGLVRLAAPVAGLLTLGYLAAGGPDALRPLRDDSGDDSRFALWQPLRDDLFESLRADGWRFRPTLEHVRDQMALYALVLLVAPLLVVLWRYRRADDPAEVTVATGLAYLIVATYVVPWYPAALVGVAALVWRSRAAVLLWVQGAFLLVAYAEPPGTDPSTALGVWLEDGGATWIGLGLLVALLVWCRPSPAGARGVASPPVSSPPDMSADPAPDDPDGAAEPAETADEVADIHEWVSFDLDGFTWVFDVTFLLSNWTCIFLDGCPGVLTAPAPELVHGCCTYGAHFADKEDRKRIGKLAASLGPEEWQLTDVAAAAGGAIRKNDDGDWVTLLHDDACVFLNRLDAPGGPGCALHQAALARDERPVDWKPAVLAAAAPPRGAHRRERARDLHAAGVEAPRLGSGR